MARERFTEKATSDPRSEGREGAVLGERVFQEKETELAKTLGWHHLWDGDSRGACGPAAQGASVRVMGMK